MGCHCLFRKAECPLQKMVSMPSPMILLTLPFLFKYTFNLQVVKRAKAVNTSRLRASELAHVEYKDENFVTVIALVAPSIRKKRQAPETACLSSKKLSNKSLSKFDLRSCGAPVEFWRWCSARKMSELFAAKTVSASCSAK
ncbi:hypothetical protein GOP47_0000065 [Adiantum capillus-veneris]|uniref:Uncharacterized protein n=1 Tax=Adiantum capillus-veneris TaxID=13818 RepID=A0A9D4VCB7_ADICA|nr:hypothetical protein GOP47_0000065 [Adiantum capillus-veneris]